MAAADRNDESAPLEAERRPFGVFDWLLLAAAATIWGSSFLFMDVALDAEHPGLITWLRPVFGLAAVACFPAARRPVERADRGRLLILGITWMAFPFTLFPLAQQWIDSSVTGMLNSAMPVATVFVGAAVFGVAVQRPQVLGIGVGIVGIIMIGLPTARGGDTSALGVVLVVGAVEVVVLVGATRVGLPPEHPRTARADRTSTPITRHVPHRTPSRNIGGFFPISVPIRSSGSLPRWPRRIGTMHRRLSRRSDGPSRLSTGSSSSRRPVSGARRSCSWTWPSTPNTPA